MTDLETLRSEVRGIDGEIIRMIARRTELTTLIGREKEKARIPLRDWEVEKAVLENAVRNGSYHGLTEEFVTSVMQLIIRESRLQQESRHFSGYKGELENIVIVGGLGGMGRWFSRFFRNQGHNVSIYDTGGGTEEFVSHGSLEEAVETASFICVATSLEGVPAVIDSIVDLDFGGTVFDIASLKGHLKESVESAGNKGVGITSIHPMFGPAARTLSDKVLCLCDCGDEEANRKVEGLFADTAVSMVRLSFDEHDKAMTLVLGLAHFINIVNAKMLSEGGYSYDELKEIGSTTFFSQMITTESVIKENPDLYYGIQRCNPFKEKLYEELKETVEELSGFVLKEDRDSFVRTMRESGQWIE